MYGSQRSRKTSEKVTFEYYCNVRAVGPSFDSYLVFPPSAVCEVTTRDEDCMDNV